MPSGSPRLSASTLEPGKHSYQPARKQDGGRRREQRMQKMLLRICSAAELCVGCSQSHAATDLAVALLGPRVSLFFSLFSFRCFVLIGPPDR